METLAPALLLFVAVSTFALKWKREGTLREFGDALEEEVKQQTKRTLIRYVAAIFGLAAVGGVVGSKQLASHFARYAIIDLSPPSQSAVQPLYYESFDTFPDSLDIGGRGPVQDFAWGSNGTFIVSDVYRGASGKSLLFRFGDTIPGEDPHYWDAKNFNFGDSLQEVWIEFYLLYPDSNTHTMSVNYIRENVDHGNNGSAANSNNKFLCTYADLYTSEPLQCTQTFKHSSTPGPDDESINIAASRGDTVDSDLIPWIPHSPPDSINGGDTTITVRKEYPDLRGSWMRIRFHQKIADCEVWNGEFHIWWNEHLKNKVEGFNNWDSEPGCPNNYILQGYLLGSTADEFQGNTYIWLDDFSYWTTDPGWN